MSNATTWLDQLFKFPGGTVSLNEGDAARVEDATNLVNTFNVIYTGALTANRTVTFPLPTSDEQSYNRSVFNDTTGGYAIIVSVGVGTTVTLNAGVCRLLTFEPAGVRVGG